jgi:hypothetical protein
MMTDDRDNLAPSSRRRADDAEPLPTRRRTGGRHRAPDINSVEVDSRQLTAILHRLSTGTPDE